MVNPDALAVDALAVELAARIRSTHTHASSSRSLAKWSETWYWELMEGQYKDQSSHVASRLRDILGDIVVQWECLEGYAHETGQLPEHDPEFPPSLLKEWGQQIPVGKLV